MATGNRTWQMRIIGLKDALSSDKMLLSFSSTNVKSKWLH